MTSAPAGTGTGGTAAPAGTGTTAGGTAAPAGTGTTAGGTVASAPAGTGNTAATGTAATGTAATGTAATGNTARGTGNTAATGAQGTAREPRVMIGYEAVQASDDEAWHEGAARAAATVTGAPDSSLEDVVIASSSVNGRVTRVGRNAITVRDREGGVYELQLDRRSRGVRQGRRVSLRNLEEGTPVRAQFVLMGGRTVARDVQIRR